MKAIPPTGKSYTMTLDQVVEEFRMVGIKTDKKRISDGIKSGIYPFGRIISVGPTGRCCFEIWRKDLEAFLDAMNPNKEDVPA